MKIDLHGTYIYELEKKLDTIIVEALIANELQIELITGQGPLQKKVAELCRTLYNYSAVPKMGNPGILIINLE